MNASIFRKTQNNLKRQNLCCPWAVKQMFKKLKKHLTTRFRQWSTISNLVVVRHKKFVRFFCLSSYVQIFNIICYAAIIISWWNFEMLFYVNEQVWNNLNLRGFSHLFKRFGATHKSAAPPHYFSALEAKIIFKCISSWAASANWFLFKQLLVKTVTLLTY